MWDPFNLFGGEQPFATSYDSTENTAPFADSFSSELDPYRPSVEPGFLGDGLFGHHESLWRIHDPAPEPYTPPDLGHHDGDGGW